MYIENLKNYRYQKEFTLQEVADKLNITRQYVSSWERKNEVPEKYIAAITELYGIELDPVPELTSDIIKDIRLSKNMSKREFARLLEVTPGTIQRWENNYDCSLITNKNKMKLMEYK